MKAKINFNQHTLITLIGGSVLFSFSPAYMAAGTIGFIGAASTALFTSVTFDLFNQLTKTFLKEDLPELQKQNGSPKTKFGKKLRNTGKFFTKHSSPIAFSIGIISGYNAGAALNNHFKEGINTNLNNNHTPADIVGIRQNFHAATKHKDQTIKLPSRTHEFIVPAKAQKLG